MPNYIKHPYPWLRKQMRAIGAKTLAETKDGVNLRLPDGTTLYILKRLSAGSAVYEVKEARKRLGHRGGIPGMARTDAPPIDAARVVISPHAGERFKLMRAQASVTADEVIETLLHPASAAEQPSNRWVYKSARIAAVVAFDPDGTITVVTVLWATDDLAEAFPRPDKEVAPAATGA